MKKLSIIFSLVLVAASIGCKKDGVDQDLSFLNSATVSKPGKIFDISNDNTGNVRITPTAEGASSTLLR